MVVIDEIGKMELFSCSFCDTVEHLFELSNVVMLATVPISKGKPIQLVERLKGRTDVKLLTVSRTSISNRYSLVILTYIAE